VVVLMSYTQNIQGDSTVTSPQYSRFAGFYDVIYVRLVRITSPRNLRVIYGVNRNLAKNEEEEELKKK